MKASLLFTLLSLIAFAYGASVAAPATSESSAISKGETRLTLQKVGKAFQDLGKILQGETGSLSREELQTIIVSTLSDLKDFGGEYSFTDILVSAAIANGGKWPGLTHDGK